MFTNDDGKSATLYIVVSLEFIAETSDVLVTLNWKKGDRTKRIVRWQGATPEESSNKIIKNLIRMWVTMFFDDSKQSNNTRAPPSGKKAAPSGGRAPPSGKKASPSVCRAPPIGKKKK